MVFPSMYLNGVWCLDLWLSRSSHFYKRLTKLVPLWSITVRETQISTSRPWSLILCSRLNTIFYFFEVRDLAFVEFRDPCSAPPQVSLFFTVTIKPQSVHVFRWWKADGGRAWMVEMPDTAVGHHWFWVLESKSLKCCLCRQASPAGPT